MKIILLEGYHPTPFVIGLPDTYDQQVSANSNLKLQGYVALSGIGTRGDGSAGPKGLMKITSEGYWGMNNGKPIPGDTKFMEAIDHFNYVAIFPQTGVTEATGCYLTNDQDGKCEIDHALEYMLTHFKVDPEWVAAISMSLGSYAYNNYFARSVDKPKQFCSASMFSAGSAGTQATADNIVKAGLPVQYVHAADDPIASSRNSSVPYGRIIQQAPNHPAVFTMHKSGGHNGPISQWLGAWGAAKGQPGGYLPSVSPADADGFNDPGISVYKWHQMNRRGKPYKYPTKAEFLHQLPSTPPSTLPQSPGPAPKPVPRLLEILSYDANDQLTSTRRIWRNGNDKMI